MTPPDPETMPSSMQAPRFTETYIAEALSILRDIDHDDVEELVGHLALASTIYVCGLGGSAAHASHMANDLTKLCGKTAICPTDNVALMTALANDEDFETWLTCWFGLQNWPDERNEAPGSDGLNRTEDLPAVVPCVSVQLAGPDDRPEQYLEIDEGVIVKLPLEWLPRMPPALDRKRFNLTAILSEEQAALAVMANPKILSVFWNRSLDAHLSPADVVSFAKKLVLEKSFAKSEDDEYDPPEILVGSIRTVKDVVDAFKAEADIITVPPVILAAMHRHAGTTKFLQECAG